MAKIGIHNTRKKAIKALHFICHSYSPNSSLITHPSEVLTSLGVYPQALVSFKYQHYDYAHTRRELHYLVKNNLG